MKLNLQSKIDLEIVTTDGVKGHVLDFVFDEKKWNIRYLLADFSSIAQNSILIPTSIIDETNWEKDKILLDVKSSQLISAPNIGNMNLITRSYEIGLNKHFNAPKYWKRRYVSSMGKPTLYAPKRVMKIDTEYVSRVPKKMVKADDNTSKVRRFGELAGFFIKSETEPLGLLRDMIFKAEGWTIQSVVVENKFGKFQMPLSALKKVDFNNRIAIAAKNSGTLRELSAFNAEKFVNQKAVVKHYDYRGKPSK